MKYRCHSRTFKWIVVVLVVLATINIMYFTFDFGSVLKVAEEHFDDQNLGVLAERWIVVDGTDISIDDMSRIDDVSEWRILVFGEHITSFKRRRCTNCMFTRDIATRKPSSVTNIKMASYVHAISHGAKWIYVTNQIENLNEQIKGYHLNETVKGLLSKGQAIFDSDQHFGAKDLSTEPTLRQKYNSYLLGKYITPSVQLKWKPLGYLWEPEHADSDKFACRLPHAIIPAHLFPPTNIMGSFIEYKSFWVLGSLVTEPESPSLAYWWLRLMQEIQETFGIHPPSCENASLFTDTEILCLRHTQTGDNTAQCSQGDSFLTCGIYLAEAMATRGFVGQSDVVLLKSWFDTLLAIHFKEPLRDNSKKKSNLAGPVHRLLFAPGDVNSPTNSTLGNPFQDICESKLPIKETSENHSELLIQNTTSENQSELMFQDTSESKSVIPKTTSVSPFNDILLIVIFNYPTHYSNALYLDYMYRKYFTNILYCGMSLDNFNVFQKKYLRPISFLEVNEIGRGYHGYLCSAYAMEMGFKVSGYLQISDDVLLNMWNIDALPRDKIWFQHSIRNGTIQAPKVPNITPVMKVSHWWPWSSPVGVLRLKETFVDVEQLKKTPEQSRAVSFLKQLETNLGGASGGFYEASDIFYVPDRYKANFNFFSKISFKHHLFLEIAIPTMLCGCDDINSIVRLNGTYLWYQERTGYTKAFNPENYFLHPWKLKQLMTQVQSGQRVLLHSISSSC